jgi:pilus assembly protein CpaB
MNRNSRTFVVVAVAVLLAGGASYAVYRAVARIPVREVPVAHYFAVVAKRDLPLGTLVAKEDVKLVPWPSSDPLPGGFDNVDKVVNRGVIAAVLMNEPLSDSKLAPIEAGAGLPPTIPEGMRAISVKVNEVIGVAGFVVPGTHVDVLAMVRENNTSPMSRTVVTNVQVLTSGTRIDQEQSRKDGKPISTSVVTLAVTPKDAEKIALAATDGQIVLALRNPLDVNPTETNGVRLAELMNGAAPPPVVKSAPGRKVAVPPPAPPPVVAPPPSIYRVEAIRASKRTEEVVR